MRLETMNKPKILIYAKDDTEKDKHLKELIVVLEKTRDKIIHTSEKILIDDIIEYGLHNGENPDDTYGVCDVLIIDDIQLLGNSESVQNRFLRIIHGSTNPNQEVIVTCDIHPKLIKGLNRNFQNHLCCGNIFKR